MELLPERALEEIHSKKATDFFLYLNRKYKDAIIDDHFLTWQAESSPLISEETDKEIMEEFKTVFPITEKILFTLVKSKKTNRPHLVELKRKKAFESFLAMVRVQNKDLLTYWAMCPTLGHIATGMTETSIQPNIFRRSSLTVQHAFRLLDDLSKGAETNMRKLLQSEHVISAAVDNHQQIRSAKDQRGGYSCTTMKGTVRVAHRNFKPAPPVGSIVFRP